MFVKVLTESSTPSNFARNETACFDEYGMYKIYCPLKLLTFFYLYITTKPLFLTFTILNPK